ncbi:MAG: adenosylcobinamide-GDP ribazoletransferase [Runella sp.]
MRKFGQFKVPFSFGERDLGIGVFPNQFCFSIGRFFVRWIGGYTGDCLGTTQQVSEMAIYLFLCGLWKFTC